MYFTQTIKSQLISAVNVINEKYPLINAGGCGIFAKIVGNQLTKMGFEVKYALVCRYEKCANEASNVNNSVDDIFNTSWVHVLTVVNGHYIDSTGIYKSVEDYNEKSPKFKGSAISEPMPKKIADDFLSNKHRRRWNPMFNRRYSGVIAIEFIRALKKVA